MSKPTPGPWAYVPKLSASENHKGFFIRAKEPRSAGLWALADVQPGDEDGKIGAANASLIASAPELLEALLRAKAVIEAAGYPVDTSITNAIAKATGEQS